MKKVLTPYISDIIYSIELIQQYVSAIEEDKDRFEADLQLQDAVIRRLEVIGEATKRLEAEFKDANGDIPWRKMAGMRDVLIHDYDEVDLDLIWEVIINDLPDLRESLSKLD